MEKQLLISDTKLYEYAFTDAITGLNNKNYITEILPRVIKNRTVNKYSVIILDIDNFKHANDIWGYELGNKILNKIGKILTNNSISESIVSYSGADRFIIVIFESMTVNSYVESILKLFRKDLIVDNLKISLTGSIGVYINENNANIYEVLQNADIALNSAKGKGKNCAVYYNESLKQIILRKSHIIEKLKIAIDNNKLDVYYQPQVRLKDEKIIRFEALIRWTDEDYGYISPSEFIPLAEENEIILHLGRYVIKKVCQQIKSWNDCGLKDISVAVNLSTRQFKDISLPSYIFELLKFYELSSENLEFEVTETTLAHDIGHSNKMLKCLQEKGINIAIDDFGTGFSSYRYLNEMNFNSIKIDKTFIDCINTDKKEGLIVKNIIDLAHIIGFEVVAEGVEKKEQMLVLKKYGCDIIQGFYYSKPKSVKELEVYMKKQKI